MRNQGRLQWAKLKLEILWRKTLSFSTVQRVCSSVWILMQSISMAPTFDTSLKAWANDERKINFGELQQFFPQLKRRRCHFDGASTVSLKNAFAEMQSEPHSVCSIGDSDASEIFEFAWNALPFSSSLVVTVFAPFAVRKCVWLVSEASHPIGEICFQTSSDSHLIDSMDCIPAGCEKFS